MVLHGITIKMAAMTAHARDIAMTPYEMILWVPLDERRRYRSNTEHLESSRVHMENTCEAIPAFELQTMLRM
jgi:hypothetical protein